VGTVRRAGSLGSVLLGRRCVLDRRFVAGEHYRARPSVLLLDIDGVPYVEDEPVLGAVAAARRLRAGRTLRVVTNSTSRSRAATLAKLARLGFTVAEDELVTPAALAVRAHTWEPQLSALRPSCICSSGTFIGDYFGIASSGGLTYTTSVSTFNDAGENPFFHQQQIVARVAAPLACARHWRPGRRGRVNGVLRSLPLGSLHTGPVVRRRTNVGAGLTAKLCKSLRGRGRPWSTVREERRVRS
jgi:hypothetical protein